jgi:hypothetical protein
MTSGEFINFALVLNRKRKIGELSKEQWELEIKNRASEYYESNKKMSMDKLITVACMAGMLA